MQMVQLTRKLDDEVSAKDQVIGETHRLERKLQELSTGATQASNRAQSGENGGFSMVFHNFSRVFRPFYMVSNGFQSIFHGFPRFCPWSYLVLNCGRPRAAPARCPRR